MKKHRKYGYVYEGTNVQKKSRYPNDPQHLIYIMKSFFFRYYTATW